MQRISLERYTAFEVYKNLEDLLAYRNVVYNYVFVNETDFKRHMTTIEYILIKGTRNDKHGARPFVIVLIAPGSSYALSVPRFKQLMRNIVTPEDLENKTELVFISEFEFTNFIKTQLREDKKQHRAYIENYTYDTFSIVVPKHVMVPKHEIADEQSINKFCEYYRTNKNRLPQIFVTDPMVAWLGARPGDVLRIFRESEHVGRAIGYRIVVKSQI